MSGAGGRGGPHGPGNPDGAAERRANGAGPTGGGLPPADLELDCRDLLCPRPVIELARHLADVPEGGVLAVVATDAAARTDVPAWCRMRGQEYLGEDAAPDGAPRYLVRRVGG